MPAEEIWTAFASVGFPCDSLSAVFTKLEERSITVWFRPRAAHAIDAALLIQVPHQLRATR
jgi:hypothetical protein